jgi:quercetin dioxygenase-like cupin family protein
MKVNGKKIGRKKMEKIIKNIEIGEVLHFADQVSYLKGQIVSKTLVQNDAVSITLFAFDKEEEISSHESDGDALVIVLDGEGQITIDGKCNILTSGDSILMPAKHPHAVYAPEQFKMLLIVVFPKK